MVKSEGVCDQQLYQVYSFYLVIRHLVLGNSTTTIETDVPVAWYVCLSVTRLLSAKTAAVIEILFGVEISGAQDTLYWMGRDRWSG